MIRVLGISTRCHRAHDGTGAPATSWAATTRATDGLKQVMSATGGLTTNPGSARSFRVRRPGHGAHHETKTIAFSHGQRRYGRVSNGRVFAVRDKTTKPARHEMPWPIAPRTADGRMGAGVCNQGPHHETRVVRSGIAVEVGRTCQPKPPPVRRNQCRRIA